jgi:hypothetical protein
VRDRVRRDVHAGIAFSILHEHEIRNGSARSIEFLSKKRQIERMFSRKISFLPYQRTIGISIGSGATPLQLDSTADRAKSKIRKDRRKRRKNNNPL